jgi:hypothetical protein
VEGRVEALWNMMRGSISIKIPQEGGLVTAHAATSEEHTLLGVHRRYTHAS